MDETELERALRAAAAQPDDVSAQITAAYACDRFGDEGGALQHYRKAWELGVPTLERRAFLVGYGSTLRNVGTAAESVAILREGVAEFPDYAPLHAFLALSLHRAGRYRESMSVALTAVLAAEGNGSLDGYDRALRGYRDKLAHHEEDLGLSFYEPADPDQRQVVEAAKVALEEQTGRIDILDETEILIGDDLVFVPCGFIGSVGALFVPSSAAWIDLGSYTSLSNFVWAYRRGFDLAGHTGDERGNTFLITSVSDRAETTACLKRIFNARYVNNELVPQLDSLPLTLEGVDLYFAIPELRRADAAGYFAFEIR